MKKSELVKMIREEVASILREKSMKRKNIKEEDSTDPALMSAQKAALQADIKAKQIALDNAKKKLSKSQ
jgi:hypothetical protein